MGLSLWNWSMAGAMSSEVLRCLSPQGRKAVVQASTTKFVAEMCRRSYYDFFVEMWRIVNDEPLHQGWYIRRLCDELQSISERVFRGEPRERDTFWNCPPGTSKSSGVSVFWQPWIWTRMPSARFISGSHSERLALDLSRKSRDVITSPKYADLFPEIKLREDQNTKAYFVNSRGGMRYAVGVGGSVIGMHAHFIAVDDPLDPQGALSDLILEEANTWMRETLSRRKVNLMLTPTVTIMQRLHQNDPTGEAIERTKGKVNLFVVPADTSWEIKPPSLKQFYSEDGLLDEVRLPAESLEEARETLGEAAYAGQYGQNPVPRGGAMFNVEKFSIVDHSKIPTRWKRGLLRYWDKAASYKRGAWTVGTWMGLDENEDVWVLDVKRDRLDSGRREKWIDQVAMSDGKRTKVWVEQEPAGSGKESAENTVNRLLLLGFRANMDKVTGDKELRADPFSVYVNQGKVILVKAPWNHTFIEEYRFFPHSTFKDQVDSGSGGFSKLAKSRKIIGAL